MLVVYEYIKYFLVSKGRHSFHSPFVYDFKDKCLTSKIDLKFLDELKKLQKSLKSNQTVIEVADFGAGSKKLGLHRKVSQIYSNAATKGRYLEILSQLVSYYDCKNVLELGTSLGVGTFALSYGSSVQLTTVDACEATQCVARENFPKSTKNKVKFVCDQFSNFIASDDTVYDLIFVDGHHDGVALMNYMQLLDKNSHDETIFVLDDIRWSESMLNAWNELKSKDDYHLSLDLFKFGILVKRKHQAQEHFVVRK